MSKNNVKPDPVFIVLKRTEDNELTLVGGPGPMEQAIVDAARAVELSGTANRLGMDLPEGSPSFALKDHVMVCAVLANEPVGRWIQTLKDGQP